MGNYFVGQQESNRADVSAWHVWWGEEDSCRLTLSVCGNRTFRVRRNISIFSDSNSCLSDNSHDVLSAFTTKFSSSTLHRDIFFGSHLLDKHISIKCYQVQSYKVSGLLPFIKERRSEKLCLRHFISFSASGLSDILRHASSILLTNSNTSLAMTGNKAIR